MTEPSEHSEAPRVINGASHPWRGTPDNRAAGAGSGDHAAGAGSDDNAAGAGAGSGDRAAGPGSGDRAAGDGSGDHAAGHRETTGTGASDDRATTDRATTDRSTTGWATTGWATNDRATNDRAANERAAGDWATTGWVAPVPPAPPRRFPWRTLRLAAVVIGVVGVLGIPLGLLWAKVAPTVPVRMTADGAILAEPQPEQFVAADGWFTLVGFVFGALAAVAVWVVLRRHRGPLMLVAVVLGALGAGLLAWWLGRQLGLSEYERLLENAPVGARFGKPADLRAAQVRWLFGVIPYVRGDVLVPAFGAAVAYTLLAGWSRFASLRAEPDPEPEPRDRPDGHNPHLPVLSWDSTERPAHPAAPAPPGPGEAAPTPD